MCQEMTAAVWGQMIRTLRLAWKVETGRIFSSSDFRVCKKFFLYLLQNLKKVIFQDVFLDTSRTLTGKWQTAENIGPSPRVRFFRYSIYIFIELLLAPCSLLELQETPNEILTHSDNIKMPYLTIYITRWRPWLCEILIIVPNRWPTPTDIQSVIPVPANERWRGMEEDGAARRSVLMRWEEDRTSHLAKRPSNFHHSL